MERKGARRVYRAPSLNPLKKHPLGQPPHFKCLKRKRRGKAALPMKTVQYVIRFMIAPLGKYRKCAKFALSRRRVERATFFNPRAHRNYYFNGPAYAVSSPSLAQTMTMRGIGECGACARMYCGVPHTRPRFDVTHHG